MQVTVNCPHCYNADTTSFKGAMNPSQYEVFKSCSSCKKEYEVKVKIHVKKIYQRK